MTIPQAMMRNESQMLGRTFLRMMLDGISEPRSVLIKIKFLQACLTKDDVGHKKDGARNVVLVASQTQVFIHAFNLCISNVASVDMREKIEDGHDGDKTKVDLCRRQQQNFLCEQS